jgi:hypothetical protein
MAKLFTPFGWALKRDEDAKDAINSAGITGVSESCKIFIPLNAGPNEIPLRPQQIVGTLRMLQRKLKETYVNHVDADNLYVIGHWRNASMANIVVATTNAAVGDDTCFISVSGNFIGDAVGRQNATHFIDETVNQLINVFLERAKGT